MSQSDFVLGYGSLLNRHSRETYSGITGEVLPVRVAGWRRGWTVRYRDEAATYAGVRAAPGRHVEAVVAPTSISPELRDRERGYDFLEVEPADIHPVKPGDSLPEGRFWIVVNREQVRADDAHPICQSYVDTCLLGCLETGGEARARAFIEQTELWDGHWVDDRDAPLYPRLARPDADQRAAIDALLDAARLLHFRHPPAR